jgi:hypothetical protein
MDVRRLLGALASHNKVGDLGQRIVDFSRRHSDLAGDTLAGFEVLLLIICEHTHAQGALVVWVLSSTNHELPVVALYHTILILTVTPLKKSLFAASLRSNLQLPFGFAQWALRAEGQLLPP